jgi:CelD/BcsL family acetyltransferase involved in cellulose biosynthesis
VIERDDLEGQIQVRHSSNELLEVSLFTTRQAFATLEQEWEELYQDSPLATPFQSWAWLYSWWTFYGEDYELRLMTVRNGALLVGLVPLMLERRGGMGRLLFVGTGLTDYQDMLARKGWETRVSEAARQTLGQMSGWHIVDLQQLRPQAAAWGVFEEWAGPKVSIWQDNYPTLRITSWEEMLMSLDRKHRSNVRRTLRRADEDRVHVELVEDDVEQAVHNMVILHREAWQGRSITQEHLSRRFKAHLQTAASWMTARGQGGISEFRRNGEVIASHFMVFAHDFVGEVLFGVRQAALQRYQMYSLHTKDMVDIALSRNISCVNWGRGAEPYKLRWSSKIVPNHRIILGRGLTLWSLYAGYYALRSKIRSHTHHENGSPWAKRIASVYRGLCRLYSPGCR